MDELRIFDMNDENNELLEAALKLAELVKSDFAANGRQVRDKSNDLIAIIERHRPKPRLVEGWVVVYKGGQMWFFREEASARIKGENSEDYSIHHLREVTDPPKWERWDENTARSCYHNHMSNPWRAIADAHNAEMERFEKAWKGGE